MLQKKLHEITADDIHALVAEEVREGRTLEFKRDAIGQRDEDKREFPADVSAMANTLGGDLIIGVEDASGQAVSIPALTLSSPDNEILRLEHILRSGLEPRLPHCEIRWIPVNATQGVIVVRTQRSWASPHRVTFREHSKFYARSSTGKYPMDVAELRASFGAGESLNARIRDFRRQRLDVISAGEGPVVVNDGPKLVAHILPVSAFTDPIPLSPDERVAFRPIRATGYNFLHTLEGFATYTGRDEASGSRAYSLIFRNGILETVANVGRETDRGILVRPDSIEGGLLEVAGGYFQNLRSLGIDPPFYISVALLDVRGATLFTGDRYFSDVRLPLRRETLLFPEVLSEEAMPDPTPLLRPLFDLLWQAFGYQRSYGFDGQGRYIGDQ